MKRGTIMNKRNEPVLQENIMRTMPVGKLLLKMAPPLVLSMLVQAFYNIVDSMYVADFSENAVTALSLAFPIQNLQIGCGVGLAVGMNSLLSKSLGEGDPEKANRAAGNSILLMLVATVGFMLFGAFGAGWYYNNQPISADTAAAGTAYTQICSLFTLGVFVQLLTERMLQSTGKTVYTLFTQGTGAILNIILDPLFIFGFEPLGIPSMGVAGAAIATVIGQFVAAGLGIFFNLTKNKEITLGLKYLKPDLKILGKVLGVGIPAGLMNAIGSVMVYGMNQILLGFTGVGETASGVFGVYFKLQSFFFMPVFGLNNAAISIIAYNYGAELPQRITKTLKWVIGASLAVMLAGVAAFQTVPDALMGIFENENAQSHAFVEMGIRTLRTISLSFPMAAVGIALSSTFQALGNGIYSTVQSLSRQLVVLLPAAYLLSLAGDVDLVWWAFPIAEIFSFAVTMIFFGRIYKKKIKPLYEK